MTEIDKQGGGGGGKVRFFRVTSFMNGPLRNTIVVMSSQIENPYSRVSADFPQNFCASVFFFSAVKKLFWRFA